MQTIAILVSKNIDHTYFQDFVSSIEMWCSTNCVGDFNIEIPKTPTYQLPTKIIVKFDEAMDAAYFKLSPGWAERI